MAKSNKQKINPILLPSEPSVDKESTVGGKKERKKPIIVQVVPEVKLGKLTPVVEQEPLEPKVVKKAPKEKKVDPKAHVCANCLHFWPDSQFSPNHGRCESIISFVSEIKDEQSYDKIIVPYNIKEMVKVGKLFSCHRFEKR